MATPEFIVTRLPRILEKLVEQTEEEEIEWEPAAVSDGYAATVGEVRFRVRSLDSDGEPPFALELLTEQPGISTIVTDPSENREPLDSLIARLYAVARVSALGEQDPFQSVEAALGIEQPRDPS